MATPSNSWADQRNYLENKLPTFRGNDGNVISVSLDFGTANSVSIAVTGIASGGFKRVNVVLADHHDNEVSVTATTGNISATVKSIAGFNKNDDLRVQVFALKTDTDSNGEMPLLATSQPDQLIAKSVVSGLLTKTVTFTY